MPPAEHARPPAAEPRGDAGFTLIEILVSLTILGVILAIGVGGWSGWAAANEQEGAVATLRGTMRDAQQQAVTEASSICVMLQAGTDKYATYLGACDAPSKTLLRGPFALDSKRVHLVAPSFAGPSGSSTGVTFSSRGTATPGSVKVTRDGSSKVWQLSVEGLTGRVVAS